MDLTSHIAALNAAKPDLIFSSMLFADLPVFMKQGHAAGLFDGVKLVLPAAGWQINQLKKEFMPEGIIFGHNTLYFDHPQASPLQKAFVAGLHGPLQGGAALGSGPSLFRARHLQGRRRGRAKSREQMADAGAGGRSHARPRGRKPRRQGPLPQGQDRRAGVLPGAIDQQQQIRFPDAGLDRHVPAPNSCKSRPVRISGSGSRTAKCRSEA